MRNMIIGIIIGALLVVGGTAFAEELQSMVGESIQGEFNVSIEGSSLDTPAIVVDGTSFLPVRALGEAIGYEVSFDPEGDIRLEKASTGSDNAYAEEPAVDEPEQSESDLSESEEQQLEMFGTTFETIQAIDEQIQSEQQFLNMYNAQLSYDGDAEVIRELEKQIETYENRIKFLEELKVELRSGTTQ